MTNKEIIKIEDFIEYQHKLILAQDLNQRKKMIQKTFLRKTNVGIYDIVTVIEVWRLGKLVASTSHIQLAINEYNKI